MDAEPREPAWVHQVPALPATGSPSPDLCVPMTCRTNEWFMAHWQHTGTCGMTSTAPKRRTSWWSQASPSWSCTWTPTMVWCCPTRPSLPSTRWTPNWPRPAPHACTRAIPCALPLTCHHRPQVKCLQYFLKPGTDAALTHENISSQVQYGVISGSSMDSLLKMMNGVYLPSFLGNEAWPESVKKEFSGPFSLCVSLALPCALSSCASCPSPLQVSCSPCVLVL